MRDRSTTSRRSRLAAVIVFAVLALAAAETPEERADELEQKLMAPCCMGGLVSEHASGASDKMKREIRQMIAAGQSDEQILAVFVERHGTKILSAPPATGFNLVPWLVPSIAILSIGGGIFTMLRRRQRAQPEESSPEAAQPLEPEMAERLRREMEKYG